VNDQLPSPAPPVDEGTAQFWAATSEGVLLLPTCRACRSVTWYPRPICQACSSMDIAWVAASGEGSVYSCTVVFRGEGAFRNAPPYVLAYVELAEGPRLLTNIVDCEPGDVKIGDAVTLVFSATDAGPALPRFRAAGRTLVT